MDRMGTLATCSSMAIVLPPGPRSATLAHVVAEHATVLRPDYALEPVGDGATRARLLVTVHPPGTRLDARPAGDHWSATPIDRLPPVPGHWRRARPGDQRHGVGLGVGPAQRGHGEGDFQRRSVLRGARPPRCFHLGPRSAPVLRRAAEGDRLEQLLAESASAQAEVTGKLGQQVRQAVELLVGAMSRANRERDGELLAGIEPAPGLRGRRRRAHALRVPPVRRRAAACSRSATTFMTAPSPPPRFSTSSARSPTLARRRALGTVDHRVAPAVGAVPGRPRRHRPRPAPHPGLRRRSVRPRPVPLPRRAPPRRAMARHTGYAASRSMTSPCSPCSPRSRSCASARRA